MLIHKKTALNSLKNTGKECSSNNSLDKRPCLVPSGDVPGNSPKPIGAKVIYSAFPPYTKRINYDQLLSEVARKLRERGFNSMFWGYFGLVQYFQILSLFRSDFPLLNFKRSKVAREGLSFFMSSFIRKLRFPRGTPLGGEELVVFIFLSMMRCHFSTISTPPEKFYFKVFYINQKNERVSITIPVKFLTETFSMLSLEFPAFRSFKTLYRFLAQELNLVAVVLKIRPVYAEKLVKYAKGFGYPNLTPEQFPLFCPSNDGNPYLETPDNSIILKLLKIDGRAVQARDLKGQQDKKARLRKLLEKKEAEDKKVLDKAVASKLFLLKKQNKKARIEFLPSYKKRALFFAKKRLRKLLRKRLKIFVKRKFQLFTREFRLLKRKFLLKKDSEFFISKNSLFWQLSGLIKLSTPPWRVTSFSKKTARRNNSAG